VIPLCSVAHVPRPRSGWTLVGVNDLLNHFVFGVVCLVAIAPVSVEDDAVFTELFDPTVDCGVMDAHLQG